MSSSASKSKPKKTSNLRILWIPGRKKHNRKGTFNATKSGLPQTYGMQPRKNEPWTLGGPLNHTKIINAELPEHHLDLATMAGITTGAMSLVSKGPTEPDADCAAMPQIATTELNGSNSNLEAIATSTTEQPQPVEDEGAVGGRSSPSSTIVVPIELNNLNGGDVANSKEKEIATSNQFEALALIDEDEEPEVKDRNCSNAQSSSSLLSSNNDNRSVENVHNGSTLAIGEQPQAQQQNQQQPQQQQQSRQRRRSTASKKNSADEDIDSIDRADSSVDMVRAFAEREPHLFEYLDNGVPYLKRQPRTPYLVMMKKERRRNRSRKRSTVRRRSQQACGIQAMKSNEQQELLDEVDGKMKENPKSKDPDDAAVECLYWSLVCWDCNIL